MDLKYLFFINLKYFLTNIKSYLTSLNYKVNQWCEDAQTKLKCSLIKVEVKCLTIQKQKEEKQTNEQNDHYDEYDDYYDYNDYDDDNYKYGSEFFLYINL